MLKKPKKLTKKDIAKLKGLIAAGEALYQKVRAFLDKAQAKQMRDKIQMIREPKK